MSKIPVYLNIGFLIPIISIEVHKDLCIPTEPCMNHLIELIKALFSKEKLDMLYQKRKSLRPSEENRTGAALASTVSGNVSWPFSRY